MTGITTWWWIRHAPVPGAAQGHIYGQLDVDCDASDTDKFRRLARCVPANVVVIVSPLRRTHQTFEALLAHVPDLAEPIVEPDFAEQHFGCWQGMKWDEMQAQDPEMYKKFWTDPLRIGPPGGESFEAQMRRVRAAILRLSAHFAGRNILSFSHGGTIRAAVAAALDLTPDATMGVVIDNLSLTRLSYAPNSALRPRGGDWRIEGVNLPCAWNL